MKKSLLMLLFGFVLMPCSFAIEWLDITTPLKRSVSLDKDSITKEGGYYFYNVMVNNKVLTIQSSFASGFSKTIREYNLSDYNSLGGNYSEITKNKTKQLEPVLFGSVANTCFLKVKNIMQDKDYSIITVE